MTSTKIDQKEYLKRYLSGDKDKKKKKKKKDKHSSGKSNVRIIDDDDHGAHSVQQLGDDSDLFGLADEAPQIVGIIDERPPELKAQEDFNNSKWKKLATDGASSMWGAPSGSKTTSEKLKASLGKLGSSTKELGSDSDQSPPRRARRDSDESPPRRRDESKKGRSPPRKSRRGSDSDESPPRRSKKDTDRSLSRKGRRSDSDGSPPRRSRKDSDESPPRKSRKSKDSPQRSRKDRHRDSRESPPRRSRKDSDESPPRKSHRAKDSPQRSRKESRRNSDQSPPRRSRRDSDQSPPRRVKKERSPSFARRPIKQEPVDSDESPPRRPRGRRDSSDASPPRRQIKRERESPLPVRIKQEPRDDESEAGPSSSRKMTTTLDGKRAGLQDARGLKIEEQMRRQREKDAFAQMSEELSGRNAKTVVREKSGRRRDVEEELRKELEKRKRDDKKKEVYTRWGKGVKQVEDYKTQLEEAAHEMNKPLARYADDEDLDDYLKKQERLGDPMLDYIRSKKKDKDRKEGRPEKPAYKGAFPDNRFGIRPGYRWDGVDRSNGFEKKWFEMMGKKKATEEEAYKYSVEDM